MFRRTVLSFMLFSITVVFCFGQAGALRDYVGLISINYHPDVVAYMGKFRDSFEKKGYTDTAKAIDDYLKGLSGSGFVYVSPDETCYILTNEHVVAQSDTLSIMFERQDGARTTYERLKVLYVDEETDLALLVFDAGVKPFTQGLSFSDSPAEEGGDVFAAGFPGLGNTAIWQFSRGTVSNAIARLPKNDDSDETIGPYIQHTAQIDPGNSGGPLLVTAQGVPTGYAVVGINTLSATRRQGANYAIPIDRINSFIEAALSKEPVNERELIAKRVDEFLKGFGTGKSFYDHISGFLSNACTASNAEYAILELLDKATKAEFEDIDATFSYNPVEGMSAAVGWYIEASMRPRSGSIKISLDSIEPNDKGGFIVSFNVNNKIIKSEWIKEYGVYRMDTYGDVVTGDKALLAEKQKQRDQALALKTDFFISASAGFVYVLDHGLGFSATLDLSSFGIQFTMGQEGYKQLEMIYGFEIPIRLNSFAIIPFVDLGTGAAWSDKYKSTDSIDFDFAFDLSVQGGLRFAFAAVPGLFGEAFFKHNFFFMNNLAKDNNIFGIGVGYGF